MATGWYLENRTGTHDKFYTVVEVDGVVTARWGRRGTAGQQRVYRGVSGWDQVDKKARRGYQPVLERVTFDVGTSGDALDAFDRAVAADGAGLGAELSAAAGELLLVVVPGWHDTVAKTLYAQAIAAELNGALIAAVDGGDGDVALLQLPATAISRFERSWPRTVVRLGAPAPGDDRETLATAVALVGDLRADQATWRQAFDGARALAG